MTPSSPSELPATAPLKLLWLNPVNLPVYDQPIADLIARVKLPNAEVHVVSLDIPEPVQLTNLEWRGFESRIWFPVTRIAHFAAREGFDGYAIGCFYDTAIDEAREVSGDAIVCAPCQSALQIASNLCNRFSIIIGMEKWKVQMEDRVRHYGYADKLASFRAIGCHVDEFQQDTAATEAAIRRAVKDAIEIDKAEAVILGCTIEFGFYAQLQREFGIPIIDAVYACYKATEMAALNKVQFGWKPSHLHSMAPPDPGRLAASGVFAGPAPIGNTVIVPRA
ncbi:aspartate/glutamate racemase family protein [Novosphingobium mangrovi (ex Huang et al. 2023)]|uniref:Aspartate/glutamate racemase family protein n=1 Tax=Novosphingobium mangrovi (ex Huang et al. 2023) TaxID=2976432 RepID=A0ABT2I1X0_9SPHN|nr:aspartate/glutamate racemase family protein [Novosphingobium mangrovi (ex Huang et al. 2023)]MCT2398807.1 aspartate/glutamate racemase family protein [Novosphingobium mangrovi (ex Huang et al. 2023)]